MPDEFHYRWQYDLHSSPEALWPYVSDTNRFNQETGVPPVEDMRPGLELVNARRHLRLRRSGMWIKWEEEPFEWVRPYRFGVRRVYSSGPVSEMRTLAELSSRPEGGTRLVYQVWARPRNLLGYAAIPLQIGRISARAFGSEDRTASIRALLQRAEDDRRHLLRRITLGAQGDGDILPHLTFDRTDRAFRSEHKLIAGRPADEQFAAGVQTDHRGQNGIAVLLEHSRTSRFNHRDFTVGRP